MPMFLSARRVQIEFSELSNHTFEPQAQHLKAEGGKCLWFQGKVGVAMNSFHVCMYSSCVRKRFEPAKKL